MTTAIYTFRTIAKMTAKLTEHPVRGVLMNDIAIVSDGTDTLTFKAIIKSSPVTNLPLTVASDDGKVEWTNQVRTFNDGGMPTGIQTTNEVGASPTGWNSTVNDLLIERCASSAPDNHDAPMFFGPDSNSKVWGVNGTYVTSWDISNNMEPESFTHDTFPDDTGSNVPRYMACTYCKLNGLIHFMGGESARTHHHTFDTSTGLTAINNKEILPEAVASASALDDSLNSGKIALIPWAKLSNVYHYDVAGDSWEIKNARTDHYGIQGAIEDPHIPGKWWCLLSGGLASVYLPATDTWFIYADCPYGSPGLGGFIYNHADDTIVYLRYNDIMVYDIALNTWSIIQNVLPITTYEDYGSTHVGSNFYVVGDIDNLGYISLFSPNQSMTLTKE